LAQRRGRERRVDLPDAGDAADVDPQLERRGADRGGRLGTVAESLLDILAERFREAAVVGEELDRDPVRFAAAAQEVGEFLDAAARVGEDQVVAAPQDAEKVLGDFEPIPVGPRSRAVGPSAFENHPPTRSG
jgi:hypothetical protein